MKKFTDIRKAREYAATGKQALHVWKPGDGWMEEAPRCFRTHRDLWGHLFDQDLDRLKKTARRLGVRNIVPGHIGDCYQHVDLCGKSLQRAIEECEEE